MRQGDLYWLDLGLPSGSEPGGLRPFIVVPKNVLDGLTVHLVSDVADLVRVALEPAGSAAAGSGNGKGKAAA